MNIQLPHIVTISDLFCNFDVGKLKGKGNIKRTYKCEDKKALAKKIFLRYMFHLFTELIKGGKVFLFPYKNYMELSIHIIPDSHFKRARQKGVYRDVDLLKSNFRHYEFMLRYTRYGRVERSYVKLSNNFRQQMIDKVNEGYNYR